MADWKINYYLHEADGASGTALLLPGWNGYKDRKLGPLLGGVADFLHRVGITTLALEFPFQTRGEHMTAEPKVPGEEEVEAIEQINDFTIPIARLPEIKWGFGKSFGGLALLEWMSKRKVDIPAVILGGVANLTADGLKALYRANRESNTVVFNGTNDKTGSSITQMRATVGHNAQIFYCEIQGADHGFHGMENEVIQNIPWDLLNVREP